MQAVADELGATIAHGDADQAKALLRILIAKLQVNSRSEILPTYRLSAPTVCAQTSSVEPTEVNTNRFARLAGGLLALDGGGLAWAEARPSEAATEPS